MPCETLIIFDYSGTLSTGSVLFGRPEHLARELRQSGLAELGIGDLAVFWDQIINPTWHEGSTTPCGYRAIVQEAVAQIQPQPVSAGMKDRIARAVEAFAGSYFHHSRIDERWRPLLEKLGRDETVTVIIATDHYAEATDAIIRHLAEWQIGAIAVREAWLGASEGNFIVANSADLGVAKTDPDFWRTIRNALKPETSHSVLLVDDFGCNEQKEDRYGDPRESEGRKEKTTELLGRAFMTAVEVVPFVLPEHRDAGAPEHDAEPLFGTLIAQAAARIERILRRKTMNASGNFSERRSGDAPASVGGCEHMAVDPINQCAPWERNREKG